MVLVTWLDDHPPANVNLTWEKLDRKRQRTFGTQPNMAVGQTPDFSRGSTNDIASKGSRVRVPGYPDALTHRGLCMEACVPWVIFSSNPAEVLELVRAVPTQVRIEVAVRRQRVIIAPRPDTANWLMMLSSWARIWR